MVLSKRAKTWAHPHSAIPDKPSAGSLDNESVKLEKVTKNARPFYATGKFLFPLGLLIGTALALVFVEPQNLHAHMTLLMDQLSMNVPELPGLDLTRVEAEWLRFRGSIPEVWKLNNDGREFEAGEAIKSRGLVAKHPIILIPGVISTGLESWSTSPEYRPFFREKLWGGFNMISQVVFNKEKWIAAMMLDPITGLDPPNIKVRAAEGVDAASSFIRGYWIWSKIIENLAVVNYDTNNLFLAAYDWRLSYYNLEERDGYFSRLKTTIESFKRRQNKKVVIAAHSMGATVSDLLDMGRILSISNIASGVLVKYFMKWVESPLHGAGGPNWVENHIEAYISIAGTHLGVAKAMAAFLSGEMKDTVQVNPAGAYVLERFFSRKERQDLFRSWAGSASMWIKGGDTLWGNVSWAPDDLPASQHTHGKLIAFRNSESILSSDRDFVAVNLTSEDAGTWILSQTPSTFQKMLGTNYSFGFERDEMALKQNNLDLTKWSNPLEVSLPRAPSMKIYCVYGHGKETERSYWYTAGARTREDASQDSDARACRDTFSEECMDYRETLGLPPRRQTWIDAAYTDDAATPKIHNGVKMGEGDGTVSLLSLGAMCVEGWKRPRWNPAGAEVVTVELPHRPVATVPRGGADTSDHVDILGSARLNEIILKVATGVGHEITDNYVSNIREYAKKIQWD